jgi:hypothetical protein
MAVPYVDYFDHSRNMTFLREQAYPFLKAQAEFYADYIVRNTDTGTYDVPLACAQEGCGLRQGASATTCALPAHAPSTPSMCIYLSNGIVYCWCLSGCLAVAASVPHFRSTIQPWICAFVQWPICHAVPCAVPCGGAVSVTLLPVATVRLPSGACSRLLTTPSSNTSTRIWSPISVLRQRSSAHIHLPPTLRSATARCGRRQPYRDGTATRPRAGLCLGTPPPSTPTVRPSCGCRLQE